MRLAPGDSFDRYVIESLLGEGGTGEVYGAVDTRLRRKVALKVLRDADQGDPEAWDRQVALILREARAAATLNHPSIVAIYDVGEHQCIPYIAMEVAHGKPLRELIGADVPLAERLRILLEVARALAAAHRAGLVHRDVKPENVVVRADGAVKVLDFGIARADRASVLSEAAPDSRISLNTEEELFEGTPAYMAPERVRGEEVDARADQFAWGVVAFELLAGKLPFRDERGPATLLASILNDAPPPLERMPSGVDALVRRALAKEPAERFPSMDEVVAELSLLVPEEAPGEEEPRESASGTARQGRLGRALVVMAALLVVAVVVGAVSLSVRRWRPALRVEPRTAERLFVPTPVTALPDPPSQNRGALVAYREGLAAQRRANWDGARTAFERAASLDPALGAAHLRVAVTSFWARRDSAREALRKAILYRGTLSEQDLAILRVHEPLIQGDPPDFDEALRRLFVAMARFPANAEIRALLMCFVASLTPEETLRGLDQCLILDPENADCWQTRGRALVRLGRYDEALAAVNKCLAIAPDASDCLYERLAIHKLIGDCVSLEQQARAWMAAAPQAPGALLQLATALYGQGRPLAEVQATVAQTIEADQRAGLRMEGRVLAFNLAMVTGDFTGAEQSARALEAESKDVQDEGVHAWTTARLAEVLRETGRDEQAAEEVRAFLMRRSALLSHPHREVWEDEAMLFWRSELAEGRMSRRDYEDARRGFVERWSGLTPERRFAAWLMAYSFPARDREDAREALAAAPDVGANDEHHALGGAKVLAAWLHAKARFLAGDAAGALPDLVVATSDCNALGEPMRHTMANYYLGAAREATGDRAGACAAYGVVLSRWGKNAASRTARAVAERATMLGCGVNDP